MSLTTEDLIKIGNLFESRLESRLKPIEVDLSEVKVRLIDVQDAVVRLEKRQEEDYVSLGLQIHKINAHLGIE